MKLPRRRRCLLRRKAACLPDNAVPVPEPEDYYFDGPFLVFTAAYHLKRGYCCGNGCRHCPYDKDETVVPGEGA